MGKKKKKSKSTKVTIQEIGQEELESLIIKEDVASGEATGDAVTDGRPDGNDVSTADSKVVDTEPTTSEDVETKDEGDATADPAEHGDGTAKDKHVITSAIKDWVDTNLVNLKSVDDNHVEKLNKVLNAIDSLVDDSKEVVTATVEAVVNTISADDKTEPEDMGNVDEIFPTEPDIPEDDVTEAEPAAETDGGKDSSDEPAVSADETTDAEEETDGDSSEGDEDKPKGGKKIADAIFSAFPPYRKQRRKGRDADDGEPDATDSTTDGEDPSGKSDDESDALPIMPMSNILTEKAAERIKESSFKATDDAMAQAIRAKKAVHGYLDGIAPDFVSNGLSSMSAKAVFRMASVTEKLAGMYETQRLGRTSDDINILGLSFLNRLIDLLGEVAETTSDGLLYDVVQSMSRAVSWYEDGYYETARLLGHQIAYEASMRVRQEFDSAWNWLYRNVFTDDPSSRNLPSHGILWGDETGQDLFGLLDVGGLVKDLGNAAQGHPTTEDMYALPYGELLRLARLLDEFAEVTQSWPETYGNRPVLAEVGDEWSDEQHWNLIGGLRHGERQDIMEKVTETDEDGNERTFYRARTNQQVGLNFSAWTQDCHEAAGIIRFWGLENRGDDTAETLKDILVTDERETIVGRRKAAWKWLGDHMFMLCC